MESTVSEQEVPDGRDRPGTESELGNPPSDLEKPLDVDRIAEPKTPTLGDRKDDPGTDPETQREELIRRSQVAHQAEERPKTLNTTRPKEADKPARKG